MKRFAPATERNREPLFAVLAPWLKDRASLLEIASGTGEHAAFFAPKFPGVRWQPSDRGDDELASIAAWREETDAPNLCPPIRLDVQAPWPVREADAVLCINMIHIAPWSCCEALFSGAARILPIGGMLILYGPFRINGEHTAPSNEAFDAWLKGKDPAYGVRDLGDVNQIAAAHGFVETERVPMPANNFTVRWDRK